MFVFQCIWQTTAERNNKHCLPRFVIAHNVVAWRTHALLNGQLKI